MNSYSYYHLDVFTTERLQGNPLAVFRDARNLAAEQMQAIARELNLSETVFLFPSTDERCITRARIFTPLKELDFAGHPTIGTAHLLSALSDVEDAFAIEENVGPVAIATDNLDRRKRFWLTTPPVQFAETLPIEICAELLGLDACDFAGNPPQFLSAGSPLLFIQLKDCGAVDRAAVRPAILPHALGSLNSGGTFVFARKAMAPDTYDVYSRMFAPQIGIAEDPATGGATGPLAAYMRRYNLIPQDSTCEFTSEQGVKMGRRSVLYVRVSYNDGEPVIQVGGTAVLVASGTFMIEPAHVRSTPARSSRDIFESRPHHPLHRSSARWR